jgi:hypothetical protein
MKEKKRYTVDEVIDGLDRSKYSISRSVNPITSETTENMAGVLNHKFPLLKPEQKKGFFDKYSSIIISFIAGLIVGVVACLLDGF